MENNMEPMTQQKPVSEKITRLVLRHLGKRGPLCPSQLSYELAYSIRIVNLALKELEDQKLVGRRIDRSESVHAHAEETPWGIALPFASD
jgi:DNA-binding HxlR family transcriptional regulator